jgi:hypothetical protein
LDSAAVVWAAGDVAPPGTALYPSQYRNYPRDVRFLDAERHIINKLNERYAKHKDNMQKAYVGRMAALTEVGATQGGDGAAGVWVCLLVTKTRVATPQLI